MTSPSTEELLAFAHELADVAADITLPFFRNAPDITDKGVSSGRYDPVTRADRAAEEAIAARIRARYPEHAVLGEEFGLQTSKLTEGHPDLTWVIDPIDGTRAFVCGAPTWGTLIGLTQDGKAVAGMMDQPFTRERFFGDANTAYAQRGNAEPDAMTGSRRTKIDTAFLSTTSPDLFSGPERDHFEAIRKATRDVRYGLDCYAYCLTALGTIDLVVEAGLNAYDIVALIPIIEGAGGVVTDWNGGNAANGGRIVAASNPDIHAEAVKILSGCPA